MQIKTDQSRSCPTGVDVTGPGEKTHSATAAQVSVDRNVCGWITSEHRWLLSHVILTSTGLVDIGTRRSRNVVE